MLKNKNTFIKVSFVFVILIIVGIYAKTIFFDFVMLDDDIKIIDNYEKISNPANIKDAFFTDSYLKKEGLYYRPTLTLSLMFDAFVWGKNPSGYHSTNLILHILSCILLISSLRILNNKHINIGQSNVSNSSLTSHNAQLLLIAFFGISPLLINAVAWIPGRNDILMTIFLLLSFLFFCKVIETNKFRFTILHFIFFGLALFSKETAIIFPMILLLYQILINKSKLFSKENINFVIQWIVVILFYLHMRSNVAMPLESLNTLLRNFVYNLPLIPELIGKFFVPINLTGIPAYTLINTIIGTLVLLLMIVIIILNKKDRNYLLFALLWIIFTSLPGMFASRGQTNFDYLECRAYLPMVGMIIFIYTLIKNEKYSGYYYFKLIGIIVVVAYSISNLVLSSTYSNPLDFYNNAVDKNPNSALALNNRALILKSHGEINDAINDLELAIETEPGFAEAYFNLGNLYDETGNIKLALKLYNDGLTANPKAFQGYLVRGNLKLKNSDSVSAKMDFEKVLEYDSTNSTAYFSIASIHFQVGELNKAIEYYNKAIKYNPKYVRAYINRAVTFANLKLFQIALRDYNMAEKLDSNNNNLYYLRANAKFLNGDTTGACLDWYKATELGNREAPRYISQYCR
ncbi:MAG: tetratricopeptide repeat protein [bacterium]